MRLFTEKYNNSSISDERNCLQNIHLIAEKSDGKRLYLRHLSISCVDLVVR